MEKKSAVKNAVHLEDYDRQFQREYTLVAGTDEAGRGPLAGPVVVACVIMPLSEDKIITGINDSKKLSKKLREELYKKIIGSATAYSIVEIDNQTIDDINILQATKLGMVECVNSLKITPDILLVDAVKNLDIKPKQVAITHGDAISYNIAAASIVAKVHRDNLMENLSREYCGYYFEKHKGYGTKLHIERLKQLGACKIHRKSFIGHFVDINR